jgi:hypothetical protein
MVNIEMHSAVLTGAEITIMDKFDRIILQKDETISTGYNLLKYDISNLASAVYFIHLKFKTSGNIVVKRFVKK